MGKKPLCAHCVLMARRNSPILSGTENSLLPQGLGRCPWVDMDDAFGVGTEIGCDCGGRKLRGKQVGGGTKMVASWPEKVCGRGRGSDLDGVLKGVRAGAGGAPPSFTEARGVGLRAPVGGPGPPYYWSNPPPAAGTGTSPVVGWRDGGGGRWAM